MKHTLHPQANISVAPGSPNQAKPLENQSQHVQRGYSKRGWTFQCLYWQKAWVFSPPILKRTLYRPRHFFRNKHLRIPSFFSTALIRRPCPLKMMAMWGCCLVGLKQIFKVQKRLLPRVWLSYTNLHSNFISGLDFFVRHGCFASKE